MDERRPRRKDELLAATLLTSMLLLILALMIVWGPVGLELMLIVPLGVAGLLLGFVVLVLSAGLAEYLDSRIVSLKEGLETRLTFLRDASVELKERTVDAFLAVFASHREG